MSDYLGKDERKDATIENLEQNSSVIEMDAPSICSACSTELEPGQMFCPKCGQKVGQPMAPKTELPGKLIGLAKGNKKAVIIGGVGIVAVVIAISIAVSMFGGSKFSKLVSDMLNEYPYADNAVGSDGSYLKIDTNPTNLDLDDIDYSNAAQVASARIFSNVQSDSLDGIKMVNEKLGFTASLYEKMMATNALQGRQSEENGKYKVSWTYHPDKGLEVTYEKK